MTETGHGHSPLLVGHILKDKTFPSPKEDVLVHAREHGAGDDMMAVLRNLPHRVYLSREDVMAEVSRLDE